MKGHAAGNHGAHMLNVTQRVAIAVAVVALFTFFGAMSGWTKPRASILSFTEIFNP